MNYKTLILRKKTINTKIKQTISIIKTLERQTNKDYTQIKNYKKQLKACETELYKLDTELARCTK